MGVDNIEELAVRLTDLSLRLTGTDPDGGALVRAAADLIRRMAEGGESEVELAPTYRVEVKGEGGMMWPVTLGMTAKDAQAFVVELWRTKCHVARMVEEG